MHLSVVVPAYEEQDCLPVLLEQIAAASEGFGGVWELILIDDGSRDRTPQVLREEMAKRPYMRVLTLQPHAGKTAALEAGLRATRGQYVATLDADLQNDPADIPGMLKMVAGGECDFVQGWRKNRNDPRMRLISTKIANGVRNWLTKESVRDSACELRVYRRELVDSLKLFDGLHRFMPTLAKLAGLRVREIPVNHRPRTMGRAKYGVWNRVFRALRDTFAIRWMQRRYRRYEVIEQERS